MRDLDVINQWGIIETATSKLDWKRVWEHHEGTHAIVFTYVDREAGMSSEFEGMYNQREDGSLQRVGGPLDKKTGLKIRYGNFPMTELKLLSVEQRTALGLAERPEWLRFYDDGSMDALRKYTLLDPFRAPGFPDDIRFPIGRSGSQMELVWGRLLRGTPETGTLECELLNEPNQNLGIHKGDNVRLQVKEMPDGFIYVGFVGKIGDIPTQPTSTSPLDKLKNLFKRRS